MPTPRGDSVDTDEGPRRDTTLEVLSGLRPVVAGGSVAYRGQRLLAQRRRLGPRRRRIRRGRAARKLTPRARIVASASAALAPEIMGLGPVPATEKALAKAGLTVADPARSSWNEAFATQSLASMRRLGLDPEIVNAEGGAIALATRSAPAAVASCSPCSDGWSARAPGSAWRPCASASGRAPR